MLLGIYALNREVPFPVSTDWLASLSNRNTIAERESQGDRMLIT
jgi:hypothetical protein